MARALNSDVRFLFEEKGVHEDDMTELATAGITTMSRLSLIADSRAEARTTIAALLKLDPATPGGVARQVAVLDSWETAMKRVEVQRQQDAEAKSARIPKTIPRSSLLSLRQAVEDILGQLPDKLAPGAALLEHVFEQVEENTIEAIPLTQVLCVEDGEDLKTSATIDASGVVRIKRGRTEVAMPGDSEALRRKLRCWGLAFMYAKLKNPGRAWLKTANLEVVNEYLDHLLGERVRGLEAKDQADTVVARPSWPLLLAYEYQVRKEAARNIVKGLDFADALRTAWKDLELRERHFVTPLALSAVAGATRGPGPSGGEPALKRPRRGEQGQQGGGKAKGKQKGAGDGKQKGAGKGKQKGGKGGLKHSTPDGRQLCYAYNNAAESCDGTCGRVHACRWCLGPHPMHACAGKQGAGKGATKTD